MRGRLKFMAICTTPPHHASHLRCEALATVLAGGDTRVLQREQSPRDSRTFHQFSALLADCHATAVHECGRYFQSLRDFHIRVLADQPVHLPMLGRRHSQRLNAAPVPFLSHGVRPDTNLGRQHAVIDLPEARKLRPCPAMGLGHGLRPGFDRYSVGAQPGIDRCLSLAHRRGPQAFVHRVEIPLKRHALAIDCQRIGAGFQ